MFLLLSAICAGMATWLWLSPGTPQERLTRLRPPREDHRGHPHPAPGPSPFQNLHDRPDAAAPSPDVDHEDSHPTWLDSTNDQGRPIARKTVVTAICAGLATAALIGGIAGILAGLLVVPAAAIYLHRKEPTGTRHEREQITTDLPFAADLMTACLLAGRPVSAATEIAANAIGGPLGRRLTWVSTQLRLGADPEPTWALLAKDPALGRLSRAMTRAAQSGAPVADVLTRLADDAREATRAAAVASARRVGVKAVAPLGLCFLPAFVLLGIIPVIAGLASTIVIP
ncbi:type II secretion system F family protein [Nonomuraea sp. NPDC049480]|uniref:type II secretion system F family protein n=1 Tax=Nonomuraea sp. NPDC049480 TaxID=3364353 RepID=UPI0037944A89